uniref:Uncharacterized protein n=1 Tax=uncultured prokaryote TaxID=198431 RepID=A0A0H5Q5L6_9ZZZZ|nr:hypothetical protein [uncultured prokaryote]
MASSFTPHSYITFGGTVGEVVPGDEIWQCGIRVKAQTSQFDEGNLQLYVDDIADALGDWFNDSNQKISNKTTLNWVKAANIDPSGKYPAGSVPGIHDYSSPPVGSVSGYNVPQFCSLVWSYKGIEIVRGAGANGRIYPPFSPIPAEGTSAVITSAQNTAVVSSQTLLAVIANAESSNEDLVVIPIIASSKGPFQAITSTRVGNVVDTQRRRRNAVKETYVSGPIPAE